MLKNVLAAACLLHGCCVFLVMFTVWTAFSIKCFFYLKRVKKHEQINLFFSVTKSMHIVILTIQNNDIPHKL